MQRIEGWEERLVALEAHYDATPMTWGKADCLTHVADACEALTGYDPMHDLRSYKTELGAAKLLKRLGCRDVLDALRLKLEECPPAMARRGDAGVVEIEGQLFAVVVVGRTVKARHPRGSSMLPRERMTHAFKIGW